MTDHPNDKSRRADYEIGYGKPPVQGRFPKGQSGNPKGRPNKEMKKQPDPKPSLDTSTRDRVLQFAERLVGGRGGDGDVKMTAEEAVMHSQLSSAVKGNSHAQKSFLERVERYRVDLSAEIEEDHARWREYIDNYNKAASAAKNKGEEMEIDWIHPDDLIFKEGSRVLLRGGEGAAEVRKNQQYVIRLRNVYMLQAAKDERYFKGPWRKTPLFLSNILAAWANMMLPKRMQLDENQYFWQYHNNTRLKMRELRRQLREGFTEIGHPEWADVLTPALKDGFLERVRALK